jgi:O-antigen ligase
MKIEHMVLLLVLVAWGLRCLSGRERLERWPLVALLGAFLGLNLAASVLNSQDLYKSVRILTRMSLAVAGYVLIVNHVRDRARLWQLVTVSLAVAAGAAAYGITAMAVWQMSGTNLGLQYSTISGAWSPYGTMWEANIFGAYAMAAAITSLVLLLSSQRAINRWFLSAVFTVTAVAMLLSLTRGAWLGFGVGGLFILLFLGKLRLRNLLMLIVGSALVLVVLSHVNPGGVFEDVWQRLGTLNTASEDINVISRLTNSELALQEWRESRWLGWGTDGFHINHPEILSGLPSPQLNALYDTGLVGVALFVVLSLAFLGRSVAAVIAAGEQPERALLLALLCSFLGLLVAYQSTDAFWLGFTWVHLALLMGAVSIVESKDAWRAQLQQLRASIPRAAQVERGAP